MKKDELINHLNEKQKKYDYSKLGDNITYNNNLEIICHNMDSLGREHGIFKTKIGKLLRGDGCPKCSGKHMDKELFVYEAKQIHKDDYIYDDFMYVNKKIKGKIFCKKHNISFLQTPEKHLQGQGCPICRYKKSAKSKTHSTEWFIDKAREIHGDKYDYNESKYKRSDKKICIICHKTDKYGIEHGKFYMTPENHLHKTFPQGCPKCARERTIQSSLITFDEFVEKANIIHNNKYDYVKDSFINMQEKMNIICPIHGIFQQKPSNHTNLHQGCPKCSNQLSINEEEVYNFIKTSLPELMIEQRNRSFINPLELDIYIPQKNIAVEYNGLIWHSEKFNKDKYSHIYKTNLCKEKGVRLIHIFEDEWLYKQDIVKSRLSSVLGLTKDKLFARKCEIREVIPSEAMSFYEQNHLQGKCKGKYHYGLYYNDMLVSLMTFGNTRQQRKFNNDYDNTWELLRFANKLNTTVVGGASKLLKYFIKSYKPKVIISYADKRWSDGNLYKQLGFTHTHDSNPNYFYINGKLRENRFKYRKGELVKQGFDPNKSEHEIMLERGIYRIYDCGTMVFKMEFN